MTGVSRRAFISAAIAIAASSGAQAQNASESGGARVALKGYDPVSYFTDGRPEQGSQDFTFGFDDTTYWFKSADHRAKFASDPERYAPQFDGYCAMMLARGVKTEADPHEWAIVNGKLYVFSKKIGLDKFRRNVAETVEKATGNLQKLRSAN